MKGISKTAHAGVSPLIPAVLAPPEVITQAVALGFIPPPLNPTGARLETKELSGSGQLARNRPPTLTAAGHRRRVALPRPLEHLARLTFWSATLWRAAYPSPTTGEELT